MLELVIGCGTLAVLASTARAQANTSPINISNSGTVAPPESGVVGGQPPDLSLTVTSGQVVGDSSANPSISITSSGGAGGTGRDGGDPTGSGGAGGASGRVSLTMASGSAVYTGSTASSSVMLTANGGAGATAGKMGSVDGMPGSPGSGGASAAIQFTQNGSITSTNGWNGSTPGTAAVSMVAIGGAAAEPLGSDGAQGSGKQVGPSGGNGGAGGSIVYNLNQAYVTSAGSGIVALSQGGQAGGGYGADSYDSQGTGGAGGIGGNGGLIQVFVGQSGGVAPIIKATGAPMAAIGAVIPIDAEGHTAQAAVMAAGIQAQSIGGGGGAGGTGDGGSGKAGAGGSAGDGGGVAIDLLGTNILTTGFAAAGVLAQSIGGAGGNGAGAGGIWSRRGGHGGAGGNASEVDVGMAERQGVSWPTSQIYTTGDDSMGVVAQSIGGGGGAGGAVQGGSVMAGVSIGGEGEGGGLGNVVTLYNGVPATANLAAQPGFIISTQGEHSSALVAQSIGGGGGTGGSASNTVVGPFAYTIGGTGGSGGNAGRPGTTQVTVYNLGILSTAGNSAKGLVAQAVGGGGGDGGSAQSLTASGVVSVNVTVGGSGGGGGSAGDVVATNGGVIQTSGADAWGMLAQSVSGGGGNGGMSKSMAFEVAPPGVPSLVVNATIGGNGGDGSPSGNIKAANNAVVMTAGAAAHGILAQSISDGGGNGGDSSALTVGAGKRGTAVDVTIALGGTGGQASNAGTVTVDNSAGALVWTLGDSANGILAQSISGGGGSGGSGKDDTKFLGNTGSGSGKYKMSLGGAGGNGGTGGAVVVTNEGNILTMGDSANGILAQSIGGGGGLGTGGTAKGSGGKVSETITVTGNSGAPGNGGTVQVTNSAAIVTFGGNAAGILAQSVGGGGGSAGTGTTAGLPNASVSLSSYLASSTALQGRIAPYGGVPSWGPAGWVPADLAQLESWGQDYLAYASEHTTDTLPDASGGSVGVQAYLGGGSNGSGANGGVGTQGDGGAVTATNRLSIRTLGPGSPGIFAQSVGAGGGMAGATVVNQSKGSVGNITSVQMATGGNSQNAGNGGAVTATNNGNIATQGDAGFGVIAQSVGGGGGQTMVTASNFASTDGIPIAISLGGNAGSMGSGGPVTVNNNAGALAATIGTTGNDAVGIVAQSVGGGGGNIIVMQTKATTAYVAGNSMGSTNPLADASGSLNSVTVGGNAMPTNLPATGWICPVVGAGIFFDSCGNGGAVEVNTSTGSSVTTAGTNAHGILAQSIGGGGGWIVGLTQQSTSPFNRPEMAGNGGNINLNQGGSVSTTQAGAYGLLAQSIGGGGILGGDLSSATTAVAFPQAFSDDKSVTRNGSGGDITILNSGTITTQGANAHAVFAQSVGGGGGLYATPGGKFMIGTTGGEGDAGVVQVQNTGTIQAKGSGSSAIYINTQGHSQHSLVAVNNIGTIWGNSSAPAIMLTGGNTNGDGNVTNSGFIANTNGTAISAPNGFATVSNAIGGQIYGNLDLGTAGSFVNNGLWGTNDSSSGNITNAGTLNIWGANFNQLGPSYLSGTLTNSGVIQASVDFFRQQASTLQVSGIATLENGTSVLVRPVTLAPLGANILHAASIAVPVLDQQPIRVTDPGNGFIFSYVATRPDSQTLGVQPTTEAFVTQSMLYTTNTNLLKLSLSLHANWVNNTVSSSLAQAYAAFATVSDGASYVNALTNLNNEGAAAASVANLVASNSFVERMNSCPRFEGEGLFQRERDCVWGRAVASDSSHDADSNTIGYRQHGQVYQLGGQKEVASDWFVGASISADNSSLNTRSITSSVNGSGWTVGLVAKHQMGDWLISGAMTGGQMSYDSSRRAQIPGLTGNANASFDVTHMGLHSRISRQLPFDRWYLKPYLDLHATHIESNGYTERGAGALNLRASASRSDVFGASPMLEAGTRFDLRNGMTLQAFGAIGATYYSQGNLGADMQFADSAPNATAFRISSDLPQSRLKTTIGVNLTATDRLDVRLEYTGEFAEHFRSNAAALKASYKF